MKSNYFKLLPYIIIFTILYSCEKETKYYPLLLKIDSLMNCNVDSAYNLLCSIKNSELQNNEEKAFYALLLTQAKDKRGISDTNDSLISIAVNHYKKSHNYNLRSKSYLYLGRVFQENNHISKAINAYLNAINSQSNNYITQVQIYDNLAECYENQNFFNKALEMYENSYAINKENNDSTRIIYPLRGIANLSLLKEDTTKAIIYYKKALGILRVTNDSIWKSTILCDMARLSHSQKNYDNAYEYINQALDNVSPVDDLSAIFFWKGLILFDLDRYDSAFYYLKQASSSKDIYTKAASFQYLYELRKKQYLYNDAIIYNDKALILYDSIQDSQHQEEINEILKKHTITIYDQEQKQIHIKQIAILCIFSIIGIAVLIIIFMHINYHEKKKHIKLQQKLMQLISDKNEFKEELRKLSQTNKRNEKLQANLVELWEQMMQICARLFQTTDSFKKIISIEKNKYIPDKFKKVEEIKSIRTEIKNTFAEAIQNLQELYPNLTQDDILYCILCYLKLSRLTIMMCMEVASLSALNQRKYRIRKQVSKQISDFIF